jgi:hypothetical protein
MERYGASIVAKQELISPAGCWRSLLLSQRFVLRLAVRCMWNSSASGGINQQME